MKKNLFTFLCFSAILFLSGCATLGIKKTGEAVYVNDAANTIRVSYYTLSDESLHFVKLYFADGKQATLPQAVSASGARYTDEFQYVWWIKGNNASLETRNDDGDWSEPAQYTTR